MAVCFGIVSGLRADLGGSLLRHVDRFANAAVHNLAAHGVADLGFAFLTANFRYAPGDTNSQRDQRERRSDLCRARREGCGGPVFLIKVGDVFLSNNFTFELAADLGLDADSERPKACDRTNQ